MAGYKKGKIYDLPLGEVQTELKSQLRSILEEAAQAELSASLKELGVLQPIVFKLDEQGNKVVVAGARRLAAARAAGFTTIPGLFVDGNYAEIAMTENLARLELTPIEEAEGLQAVKDKQQYTLEQLAAIIGKSQTTLFDTLSLNRLPQEIRDDCRSERTITKSSLIAIAKKKETHQMTTAYNALKTKLSGEKASRQRTDANAAQSVNDYLAKVLGRIDAIDISSWSAEEKSTFQNSLTSLKEKIQSYLSAA